VAGEPPISIAPELRIAPRSRPRIGRDPAAFAQGRAAIARVLAGSRARS